MRNLVHCVCQFGHRLLCLLNFIEVGLERLSNIYKLIVKGVGPWRYLDLSILVRLGLPVVLHKPEIGTDGCPASRIVFFLTETLKLSKFTVWSNSHMRWKKNDQVSSFWHMVSKCVKTNFTYERHSCEATHVEASADNTRQSTIQTVWIMIDLIWTYTASEKRVRFFTAFLQKGKVDSLVKFKSELCLRKIALNLHHCVLFNVGMIGRLKLRHSFILIILRACNLTIFDAKRPISMG